MSIFSGSVGENPLPWLQEKTLAALQAAARLVDLANEKDTTAWYATELRRHASALIGTLAPVVVFAHQAGDEPASHEEWVPIVERGSFALAAWCKKHDIVNPTQRMFNLLAEERSAEDQEAKNTPPEVEDEEEDEGPDEVMLGRRLMVASAITRRMVHAELTEPARRILLWALSHLEMGVGTNVVVLNRNFLPTDVGITPEETAEAYRLLWDLGFIERAEVPGSIESALPLRLLPSEESGSKHPLPFEEVKFGYPGARIGGKPTVGTVLWAPLPDALGKAAARWKFSEDDRASLQTSLQHDLGEDRVYIEQVTVGVHGGEPCLRVKLRHTWDDLDTALELQLAEGAVAWLRARVTPGG